MATTPGISWIQLPNGICFPLENQRFIEVQGVNLVLTDYSGGSRSIPLGTNAIANSVLVAIEAVMLTPVSFTAILTWVSVTPTTATVGAAQLFTLTGTGLLASGINMIKLDDGAGHVYGESEFPSSDTTITSNVVAGGITVAGTYTFYYSTDGGTTWTTTGLTTTFS